LVLVGRELGLGTSLLKFTKGRYHIGDDDVPIGHEYIAHTNKWARGYVKFDNGKVVEKRIGLVADGFKVPERDELDDADENTWPRDGTGTPRDTWCKQSFLPLEDAETGEIVVFVTSSQGGRRAVSDVCATAARNFQNGQPRIRLNTTAYRHRTYGRIETPYFAVIGWTVSSEPPGPKPISKTLDDEIPF
jgi:hypothetical protein